MGRCILKKATKRRDAAFYSRLWRKMTGRKDILPFSPRLIRDRFPRMDPHIAADLSALDTAALHSRLSELGSYL